MRNEYDTCTDENHIIHPTYLFIYSIQIRIIAHAYASKR